MGLRTDLRPILISEFLLQSEIRRPVFLKDMGKLGCLVSVPFVKAVCIGPRAARSDAYNRNASFPGPCLHVLTKLKTDPLIAEAILYDQSPDKSVGPRLQPMFDGDLDPTHDLVFDTCDKGSLILGTMRKCLDPSRYFVFRPLISELLDQNCGCGRIVDPNRANAEFNTGLSSAFVHAQMVSHAIKLIHHRNIVTRAFDALC